MSVPEAFQAVDFMCLTIRSALLSMWFFIGTTPWDQPWQALLFILHRLRQVHTRSAVCRLQTGQHSG
jgi:hypothetical protein